MAKLHEPLLVGFSWRDFFRACWLILGTQRWKFLRYQVVLAVILFYEIVPMLVIGTVVDFFTSYKPGESLTFFYVIATGLVVN